MTIAIFYEQYPSGTPAPSGAPFSFNKRLLNTATVNTIPGASLDPLGNIVTLPPGTYKMRARAKQLMYATGQLFVWDYTNNVPLIVGLSAHSTSGGQTAQADLTVECEDVITLPNTIAVGLNHYTGAADVATTPIPSLGGTSGSGQVENHAQLIIESA